MANIQAPFGFRQTHNNIGSAPNYQMEEKQIAYNNSNTIAYGDPVKLLSTGYIDILAPGTTAIFGIFGGCEYVDPNFQRPVWLPAWKAPTLASTVIVKCWVITDPNAVFEVQSGNSSTTATAVTQGNIGNNIQFAGQGSPNSAGISVAYADQNTLTTTNTLPFRIVDLGTRVGNDNTSAFNTILVRMNFSQVNNTTGV